MGRRHYEPWEICEQWKQLKKDTALAESVPYTGMAVACNYSLWKDWHFSTSKLVNYNADVNEYYEDIKAGFYSYDDLQEKILRVCPELKIETVDYTDADLRHKKYLRTIEKEEHKQNNIINGKSKEYLLVFFSVLIDLGFTEKKLLKVREKVYARINVYLGRDKHIMDLHQELIEGTGIYIEVPE